MAPDVLPGFLTAIKCMDQSDVTMATTLAAPERLTMIRRTVGSAAGVVVEAPAWIYKAAKLFRRYERCYRLS